MSRKFLIASVIIFSLGILFAGIGIGTLIASKKDLISNAPPKPSEIALASGIVAGSERERAKVKKVIDGDTIELEDGRKLRYIGIDTPETVDPRRPVGCFGKEAALKNKELVENKEVELEKDISEVDKYKRLLRYVYVQLHGATVMVNEYLVSEGYATSSTYPPDVKYQELFTKAESEARTQDKGLWNKCQASPVTQTLPSTSPDTQGTTVVITTASTPVVSASTPTASGNCLIKGNISSGGKIYHLPGCGSYDKTSIDESAGERWFCTEDEAVAAGWRKAKNC